MPDSYARPNSKFWRDWQIVMLLTQYTFSRYQEHNIKFTVNEELRTEAKRAEKYRNKENAIKMAAPTAATAETAEKVENIGKFPPLIIPQ